MRHVTQRVRAWRAGRSRRPAAWVTTRPIAHRGLHGPGVVENSMSAFEAAVREGYPIELDVRIASDDTVVVFHDAVLDRLTAAQGPVAARSWDVLRPLRLLDSDDGIPRLADVLGVVAGAVPLLVELKNGGPPGALERGVAALLADYRGPVAVQSFNPRTVAWFARHVHGLDRGLLASDFSDTRLPAHQKFILRRLGLVPLCRPHFIGYDLHRLPYWATDVWRSVGLPLLAWTVRTQAELEAARRLADNVIFENVRPRVR